MLRGILWTIVVIALIIWVVGFFFAHLGVAYSHRARRRGHIRDLEPHQHRHG
jgi:hypothetical protein